MTHASTPDNPLIDAARGRDPAPHTSTEQECAEFEKLWAERPIYMGQDHQKELALRWWQAARLLAPVARVMHMEAVCAVHGKACGAACNCPRVAMARMSDGTLRHQDPIEQPRTMGLPAEIPDSDLLWRCLTHGYTKAAVEAMLSEHDEQVLQERATKAWAEIVNEVQQKGGQTLPRDAQPSVFGKDALSAIRALREWVQAAPDDVAASLPAMPGVDGDWLDRVEVELSAAPEFTHVATRKLQELQERGYVVTGYAIEKAVEGGQPERGFITAGGFVGWWRGNDEWNATVAREVETMVAMNGSTWRNQVACWCETCDKATNAGLRSRMSLCPDCGDKRCPKASHHDRDCSKSAGGGHGV